MFGAQSDPSKTEKPTPKRIRKQRQEGNVPKSQELGKAVSLVGGMAMLYVWIGPMYDVIAQIFRQFLSHGWEFDATPQAAHALALELSIDLAYLLLPIMLFLFFAAIIAQRLQVGKLWTTKVFKFNLKRFNILSGLKRMLFSPQTILRTLKSLLFCAILAIIPFLVIKSEYDNFLPMFFATPDGVAKYMLEMGFKLAKYALLPILIITVFDVWQSRFAYYESMKMTKEEVKDERKQMEGDEKVKAQMRQKMQQMVMKHMMADVPKADVVVTNPTHIAIALRYNAEEAPAPVVLAKGANVIAEKIKEIARENHVPIRENVPLARALYKATEVGDMIPEELYKAVAAVLASVWRLKPQAHTRPAS